MSFLSLIQRPLQDSRDTDLLSGTVRVSPSKYREGGTDLFFLLSPPSLLSKFSEKIFFFTPLRIPYDPYEIYLTTVLHLFSARITRACIFDLVKCVKESRPNCLLLSRVQCLLRVLARYDCAADVY